MPEFNDILDRLAIPFFSLDKNGAFNYMNKKAEEFFDCSAKSVIGRKIDEVHSPFLHQSLGIYRRAMTEQRRICLQNYCGEEAMWLEHHIYPAEDGLTACIIDITEKEKIREDERVSLSREIHDELGQQLTVLMMDVSRLDKFLVKKEERVQKKIDDITDLLNITVETVRKISTDLHPQILEDLGLVAALKWQNLEFEKRSGVSVHFQCKAANLVYPFSTATCLFRIYQETLTNVARHAEARKVAAALEWKKDGILMNIADDGRGFDIETARLKGRHGLAGMKQRAMLAGGKCDIDSAPGIGTRIMVFIPQPVS